MSIKDIVTSIINYDMGIGSAIIAAVVLYFAGITVWGWLTEG